MGRVGARGGEKKAHQPYKIEFSFLNGNLMVFGRAVGLCHSLSNREEKFHEE
jgi:hypothetical protein